jgi:hypothetical protein
MAAVPLPSPSTITTSHELNDCAGEVRVSREAEWINQIGLGGGAGQKSPGPFCARWNSVVWDQVATAGQQMDAFLQSINRELAHEQRDWGDLKCLERLC